MRRPSDLDTPSVAADVDTAPPSISAPAPPDPEVPAGVVAQLIFDFLRQLSTLSLAAAGGVVTLMQTVLDESEHQVFLIVSIVALFLAAIFALQTQQVLVERLAEGTRTLKPAKTAVERYNMPRTPKTERVLTYLAFGLFGTGIGAALMAIVLSL